MQFLSYTFTLQTPADDFTLAVLSNNPRITQVLRDLLKAMDIPEKDVTILSSSRRPATEEELDIVSAAIRANHTSH